MRITLSGKYKKILLTVLIIDVLFAAIKILSSYENIAEYLFARVISRGLSIVLQDINSLFPFSIIETMVVFLIIGFVAVIVTLFVAGDKIGNSVIIERVLTDVFVAIMIIVTFYVTIGTTLYNRAEIYQPLGLEKCKTKEALVYDALNAYLDELTKIEPQIQRDESGNAISPYDFDELNALLNVEYKRLTDDYFSHNDVRLKRVRLSFFMTFTFITGVYVAFLGESSINTNVPSYTLPVTMAHEMAHGKGCVRENDANCLAYYICVTSDNVYLKYCALMEICSSLFSKLSSEKRKEIYEKFPQNCLVEYSNANAFYDEYEGIVEKVSEFINDTHLKGSGVKEGTISYAMTDGFLCSLYTELFTEVEQDG